MWHTVLIRNIHSFFIHITWLFPTFACWCCVFVCFFAREHGCVCVSLCLRNRIAIVDDDEDGIEIACFTWWDIGPWHCWNWNSGNWQVQMYTIWSENNEIAEFSLSSGSACDLSHDILWLFWATQYCRWDSFDILIQNKNFGFSLTNEIETKASDCSADISF